MAGSKKILLKTVDFDIYYLKVFVMTNNMGLLVPIKHYIHIKYIVRLHIYNYITTFATKSKTVLFKV